MTLKLKPNLHKILKAFFISNLEEISIPKLFARFYWDMLTAEFTIEDPGLLT